MNITSYVNRAAPAQVAGVAAMLAAENEGIAFDFTAPRVLVRDAGNPSNDLYGVPSEIISTTRTTVAWYFGPDGLLKQAPANTARFDHDLRTRQPLGLLSEPAATNISRHNRDLSNAIWTKTNAVAAKDQIGLDGVAASASSLTAVGAAATVLQAITSTSGSHVASVYIKRLVGSGAVELTQDGGATWTEIDLPATGWYRAVLPFQTIANPQVGLRLAVSGDRVAVDLCQCERTRYASSPIITGAAAAGRSLDTHVVSLAELPFSATAGTVVAEVVTSANALDGASVFEFTDGTSTNRITATLTTANSGSLQISASSTLGVNASATQALQLDTANRIAASWSAASANLATNARLGIRDTALTLPAVTQLQIGGAGSGRLIGHIRKLVYIPRTVDDATLLAMSARGFPGVVPAISIAANDPALIDSDYVGARTATSDLVSIVRPFVDEQGFEYANPGWRRRFITSAPWVEIHMRNSDQVTGEHAGRVILSADGVIRREAILDDGANDLSFRLDFPDVRSREIEILAPYGASMQHRGLTIPEGYSISAASSRAALPLATFSGGSRVNGYNATGANAALQPRFSWSELLCRQKGWRQANFGAAGRALFASDGTIAGAMKPDIAFLQADTNDLFDQTPLAEYKAKLTAFIAAFRAGAPTTPLYVITSLWIPPAIDSMTLKIADYRTAAGEALTAIGNAKNILVDGLALVTHSTTRIPDGLHPNELGSAEWATNLAAIVGG